MLRLTHQCREHLRSVPDALESLISEKRLLQAAVLLVRSLKLIHKQEMMEIGALADLRSYLNTQETVSLISIVCVPVCLNIPGFERNSRRRTAQSPIPQVLLV